MDSAEPRGHQGGQPYSRFRRSDYGRGHGPDAVPKHRSRRAYRAHDCDGRGPPQRRSARARPPSGDAWSRSPTNCRANRGRQVSSHRGKNCQREGFGVTSARKIKANRANARASTGPKTAHGRANSTKNALRHALSLPVYSDPVRAEAGEALAREIAGPDANAEIRELARRVAEAQIDLRRVRCARHRLLCKALSNPSDDAAANVRKKSPVIGLGGNPSAL